MDRAADRVEAAIRRDELILVHGDYDVDGMSSASLLSTALRELGGRVVPFVPHRGRDGYDLTRAGVERAREAGAGLIVTADCGIQAHAGVEEAGSYGIDVVVTDHHRPGPELPAAAAVVDPMRPDDEYPFRGLAGVGVAFKLVQELYRRRGFEAGRLNQHLDLVALGTIADQVPLVDESRALARFGLRALDRSRKPGIRALCAQARVGRWSSARATDIAFRIAPRLNSVGRVDDAAKGLDLLLSGNGGEAEALALEVERHNTARRALDRTILDEARARLDGELDAERDAALVMWADGWHTGVLGIVASRLVDEVRRPVVLVGMDGDVGRGSARSVPGFHLHRALTEMGDVFERFGGHAAAAGFEIRRDRLGSLRDRFLARASRELGRPPEGPPILQIDQELPVREVTPALARAVTYLEPFGTGNPVPRFLASGVRLEAVEPVGKDGSHARLRLADGRSHLEAIAFGRAEELAGRSAATPHDVVYELHVEVGPRGPRPQAHVIAVRAAS